jgi:hypothetical protein
MASNKISWQLIPRGNFKLRKYFSNTEKNKIVWDFTNLFFVLVGINFVVGLAFLFIWYPIIFGFIVYKLGLITESKLMLLYWANCIYFLCIFGLATNWVYGKYKKWKVI